MISRMPCLPVIGADPGASDAAAALDLRQAVNALPDDLRLVVVLRFYGGMDSTEVGAALGIPSGTVRTRLKRALAALRDALRASGEGTRRQRLGGLACLTISERTGTPANPKMLPSAAIGGIYRRSTISSRTTARDGHGGCPRLRRFRATRARWPPGRRRRMRLPQPRPTPRSAGWRQPARHRAEETCPGKRPPAIHMRPSRRAVWGGTISAVAIVALLASAFTLIPHLRGASRPHHRDGYRDTPGPILRAGTNLGHAPSLRGALQARDDVTTEGWAIGDTLNPSNWLANPDPLLVHFHACRWEPIPFPTSGVTAYLRDISLETADDGWAAGYEGTGDAQHCLLLHYTGGQWLRAPLPSAISSQPSSCDTIAMRSPDEGWLLGTWGSPTGIPASDHLLHYTAGAWTPVDMPITGTYALSAVGTDDVWVAGTRLPTAAERDPNGNGFVRVDMAHYQHGQWTTFHLSIDAEAPLRMNSPSDGWLLGATIPQQVLHYDGVSWQPSAFSDHAPSTYGGINVLDGNDAWAYTEIDRGPESVLTSIQHYAGGQWQIVSWPFPEGGIVSPLTRVATGEYWAIGVLSSPGNPNPSNSKWVLLHYVSGAWHEYGT